MSIYGFNVIVEYHYMGEYDLQPEPSLHDATLEVSALGGWSFAMDAGAFTSIERIAIPLVGAETRSGVLAGLELASGSLPWPMIDLFTWMDTPETLTMEVVSLSWGPADEHVTQFLAIAATSDDGFGTGYLTVLLEIGGDALPGDWRSVLSAEEVLAQLEAGGDPGSYPAEFDIAELGGTVEESGAIVGSDLGELLVGTSGDDLIYGLGGPDRIEAGAGNDSVFAGAGSDSILGSDGDDYIEGGAGGDVISAAGGNDTVLGDGGNDQIGGGDGNDLIYAMDGNDIVGGGDGDDVIYMGAGTDVASGGAGNDSIFADSGSLTAGGVGGDDFILGADDADNLGGGEGNDSLSGKGGDDSIGGGDGNDRIDGGEGDDFLAGGAGDDSITGGSGDDTINGGAGADEMMGGAGADVFVFTDFVTEDRPDLIRVYEDGIDTIRLAGFEGGFEALDITLTGDGVTVRITAGEQVIFLRGTDADGGALSEDSFTAEDFLFL